MWIFPYVPKYIFTRCKNNIQMLVKHSIHVRILNLPRIFKAHAYKIIITYSKNISRTYIPKNYNTPEREKISEEL